MSLQLDTASDDLFGSVFVIALRGCVNNHARIILDPSDHHIMAKTMFLCTGSMFGCLLTGSNALQTIMDFQCSGREVHPFGIEHSS